MLQLLAFQNIRQLEKKIIWKINNSKVSLEHFGEFLSFASAKPNKSRKQELRTDHSMNVPQSWKKMLLTSTLLPQGTTTCVQVSFAMLLKQIPMLNKQCQAIFTFQNQEIIAVHHQLAPLTALPESWRMPMSEQSKRSPHRRQALNDLYTTRLSRKHKASLVWISSNPWPICVC